MMKMTRGAVSVVLAALILATCVYPAFGQLTRGFISGIVSDASGGILAGVQVTITNKATNISRDTITNDAGLYRFTAVEPGDYSVEFKLAGFEARKIDGVNVNTAQEITLNQTLRVGGVTAEVSVTEVPGAELAKSTATIERTFPGTLVEQLPLTAATRDITRLSLLSPNVVRAPGTNQFSASGQRARNNNFMLDGVDNNDFSVTLDSIHVVPEATAEVQVQTTAYSSEFGRNSGAQFSVVTKSGTNQFHGAGWDYYRGNWMEPISLTNKKAGVNTTPRFDVNQFGGDFGGPIFKNRTFFFGLAEWNRRREAPDARNASSIIIPTSTGYAALAGIPLAAGQTQASRQAALSALTFLPQVYPQIAHFDSVRNQVINGTPIEVGTAIIPLPQPYNFFDNTVRLDHKLSDRDNLMYRYYIDKRNQPNLTGNTGFGTKWAAAQQIIRQNHAFGYTRIINPHFLNEARGAYILGNLSFPENDPVTATTVISNFFQIGGSSAFPQGRFDHSWQFQDVVSYTAGHHALKFGFDVRRYWIKNQQDSNTKGTWSFNNLADFVNNQAVSVSLAVNTATFIATEWDHAYFLQDDFKATKNLTLNLGLRYQYSTVPLGFFGATDPAVQALDVPGPAQPDKKDWAPRVGFAYSPGGPLFGSGKTVLRGGFGMQYDVLFYNILSVNSQNYPRVVNTQVTSPSTFNTYPTLPPKTGTAVLNPLSSFVNAPSDLKHPATEFWTLSVQRELASNYIFEVGYAGSRSYHQIAQGQANPPILTPAQAATVVATKDPNSIPSLQARRLNPSWGSRTLIQSSAKGAYEAGYVKFDKRMSKGLLVGASYTRSGTWSDNDESLGDANITNSSPQIPEDFFNFRKEWSRSVFDRPNRFVVNYLYEVPWFSSGWAAGSLSKIMGGWQIAGFIDANSGQPFTVRTGVDSAGINSTTPARPDFNPNGVFMPNYVLTAGGPVKQDFDNGLRTFYIPVDNTGIVTAPLGPNGILANSMSGGGNLGKNTFRGPSFQNWNFSLSKTVKLHEDMQLQIRSDFSNLWNHRNFQPPVATMSSPSFGQTRPGDLITDARLILMNVKLKF
ncbi:MAG TPA: TonB-dependent receptor [Terriglobia bacterium]|nr:TonB-dependent receptor [Terriglobia bacterium]